MPKKDPRLDAYIAKAAPFARPILKHLRKLAHAAVPDVEETVKWGMPHFEHRGVLFGMAAFKAHCALFFWKGKLILKDAPREEKAMGGQFRRLTKISDLPGAAKLAGYIRKAAELNESGVKLPSRAKAGRKELVIPDCFIAALRKRPKASAAFEKFSYSHRKEYVQWITEAKREETREQRMKTAIQWLSQGKSRNWKYEKKS